MKRAALVKMGLLLLFVSSFAALMGSLPLLVASLAALAAKVEAVTLTVSPTGGNASSPLLYGIMFEDINNSGMQKNSQPCIFPETESLSISPLTTNMSQAMVESTASCSGTTASKATSPI